MHSDAEIRKNKGPPVMNEQERYAAVRACKWVDEVVEDAPYVTQLDIMDKYGCDICVHGDDMVVTPDGQDSYAAVKLAGRYRECKRTTSISTTDLVGRMLLMTKEHHSHSLDGPLEEFTGGTRSPYTGVSRMLPTSGRIVQFSNLREPKKGERIVYVDGAFDLFHIGHVEFLKKAKEKGDYVLVGIHDDETVNRIKGANFPIMNLYERVLGVLSCRYVNEVIIGAPYSVNKEILNYGVSTVLHGSQPVFLDNNQDPYALPKSLGIFEEIGTEYNDFTLETILQRIVSNRNLYEERNRKKELREMEALRKLQLQEQSN